MEVMSPNGIVEEINVSRYAVDASPVGLGANHVSSLTPAKRAVGTSGGKRSRTHETLACTELDASRQEMTKLSRKNPSDERIKQEKQDLCWFVTAFGMDMSQENEHLLKKGATDYNMKHMTNFLKRDISCVIQDVVQMQTDAVLTL